MVNFAKALAVREGNCLPPGLRVTTAAAVVPFGVRGRSCFHSSALSLP